MRKSSSSRDGFTNTLDYSGDASVVAGSTTNSASLAKAERRIQVLEADNKKLRQEFSEMSSMYHQLIGENKHERFDERRIMALKSHIMQLERQIITLSEALGSRAATLMEVENALNRIAECMRGHLAEEKATGAKVGCSAIPRADITAVVETAESARIKLYKSIEKTNAGNLERPLLMMDKFIKSSQSQPATLFDVCSGRLDHLNLKEVSKLESELVQVYKLLMLVNKSLGSIVSSPGGNKPANIDVPLAVYEKLGADVSRACNLLNSTNVKLLDLTLLVPAAPWPPLQKARMADLTTDHIMKCLPGIPRSKTGETKNMIDALLKYFCYEKHMQKLENQILTEDLNFHQTVYDVQQDYIQSLFTAVKQGYTQFEENTNSLLCEPLSVVLSRFSELKDTASEDSLREFLAVFKQYFSQMKEAVDLLRRKKDEGGKEALSEFGNQFFKSLDAIHQGCRYKRDLTINELEEIKSKRAEHLEVLKDMFSPPAKIEPDEKQEYENIIRDTTNLNISEDPDSPTKEMSPIKTKPIKKTPRSRPQWNDSITPSPAEDDLECSCTTDDNPSMDSSRERSKEREAPDANGTRKTARRPASLKRMVSNLDSSKLTSPKVSHLPNRGGGMQSPARQSYDGGKGSPAVKSSLIPGPSPTRTVKSRIPPGGRLTPIQKLKLKPKSGSATPETPSTPTSEPDISPD